MRELRPSPNFAVSTTLIPRGCRVDRFVGHLVVNISIGLNGANPIARRDIVTRAEIAWRRDRIGWDSAQVVIATTSNRHWWGISSKCSRQDAPRHPTAGQHEIVVPVVFGEFSNL